jgi:hypothetical protein
VVEVTTYTVTAEREGRWWALQCVEVPGAISQVTRLDQADVIKEAIAWVADVPEGSIEIEVIPQISADTREHMDAARQLREESDRAKRRAAEEARFAAAALARDGLSLRDIGVVMDVSFQRAQQLVSEAESGSTKPPARKVAAKRVQIKSDTQGTRTTHAAERAGRAKQAAKASRTAKSGAARSAASKSTRRS